MLFATFSIFKGLSARSEMMLWQRGFFSWKEFQILKDRVPLSPRKAAAVVAQIDEAQSALDAGLTDWFLNRLANEDKPRVHPHCRDNIRYIDIETTGLSRSSKITTIAVYDGTKIDVYVKGINLCKFPQSLCGAQLIVTYNGTAFDLPFLRRRFGLDLTLPHIDLLSVTKAYGYSGGLKACEKKMGIDRGSLAEIDGGQAALLWQRFSKYGDKSALQNLMVYNCMDVLNLETILIHLYNESMRSWPQFRKYPLPTQPDPMQSFRLIFDK